MKAYGAVAYICDETHSSFAIAKARVAPLKIHTLPWLELMATVTGSRLCKFVISSLDCFQFKITMWSDSQITLCWISNKKKLPPFVANRVNEIHDLVPTATWMYCPTQDNPGDLVTRGISFDSLRELRLWQYGPTWLTCKSQWPKWEHSETLHLQAEEGPVEEPRKVDGVPPHQHDLSFAQSWTLTAIALYRDYLECQLMYYASFITVSSPTQVSGVLVSSFQTTLMQRLMRGSTVLNGS